MSASGERVGETLFRLQRRDVVAEEELLLVVLIPLELRQSMPMPTFSARPHLLGQLTGRQEEPQRGWSGLS